jgi:hypothetical protein
MLGLVKTRVPAASRGDHITPDDGNASPLRASYRLLMQRAAQRLNNFRARPAPRHKRPDADGKRVADQ